MHLNLVGGLELFLLFHMLGITIPTDELIFFRGVGIPPTRNAMNLYIEELLLGGQAVPHFQPAGETGRTEPASTTACPKRKLKEFGDMQSS